MAETYKCPSCGAPIEFDGATGKMVCQYCETEVDVSAMDKIHDIYDESVVDETESEKEYCSFDGYRCDSCGAEIVTDENTSATFCSFCGSPTMIRGRLEGALKPQKVIPFRIQKDQAVAAYKKWAGKGLVTPSGFRKQSTIEKITGIYVPFWLYDYGSDAHVSAHATKRRTDRRGNTIYEHTDHFQVGRHIRADFEKIPADASEKMDDRTMDLLEPYNYSDLTDFQMPYLSGYQSEKFSYDSNELAKRAENRVREYILNEARQTITGYSSVSITSANVKLNRNKASYTLMPVWILNYKYKGKTHTFAMNGQTGKVVGKLPKSFGKIAAWFGGIFAGVSGLLMLLGGLLG
ncbi:MAG: hypothetical protein IJP13_01450 [Lachnospiraceae bacterium]|nr:hypothetical protein [Lachnospiraceae bacterium]